MSVCPGCKTTFDQRRPNHKYCSESCRYKVAAINRDAKAREKRLARMRTWGTENREKRRDYHYRRLYGLTLEEYNAMLAAQNGRCAVCGEEPKEHHRALAVDHDHVTGEIFGLLCTPCNKNLIGKIRRPELFERAADYLRNGSGRFVPEAFKKGQKRRRKTRKRTKRGS